MKIITLTIFLLLIASPLLASEVVVRRNGRATTFNVARNGEVVTIFPKPSGAIVASVNNGNPFDLREPSINPANPSPRVGDSPHVGGADPQ